jgi:hypothetical protein
MDNPPRICRNLHEFFLAVAESYDPTEQLPDSEQIALEDELIRWDRATDDTRERHRRPRLSPQQRAARRKRRLLAQQTADERRIILEDRR